MEHPDASPTLLAPQPFLDHNELLASARQITPMPQSVARLAGLVADPESSMKDIVEVVSFDQSLAATVLQRANSAAAGSRQPISTVREAAVRLGSGTLLAITTASALSGRMNKALPAYGLRQGALWKCSVGAALAAETIRTQASIDVPAEVATAALLHDFGKVVLSHHFGDNLFDMLNTAADTEGIDLISVEESVLGANHADVGGIVAQQWKMPATIVDGIVHHHSNREGLPSICSAVNLAHLMSHSITDDLSPEAAQVLARSGEHVAPMAALGIEPDRYPELLMITRTRFVELADRYGAA